MINRLEVIDEYGRHVIVSPSDDKIVDMSIQDEGRTLKVFIKDKGDGLVRPRRIEDAC